MGGSSVCTCETVRLVWLLVDEQAFDAATASARLDAQTRRDAMYRGLVAATATRPVFRHKLVLGYRFEYERDANGAVLVDPTGHAVRRWWVKDEAAAPINRRVAPVSSPVRFGV
jgi:hypothetical protein